MRVLVIEDGHEYTDSLSRFLADGFVWVRAGSGPEALERAAAEAFDAAVLDMRFDRVPDAALFGDMAAATERLNGDPEAARAHLQDHQGTYVLAAVREAGHLLPVLLSHDLDGQPRRWARLSGRYGPVDYVTDSASPSMVARRLRALVGAGPGA